MAGRDYVIRDGSALQPHGRYAARHAVLHIPPTRAPYDDTGWSLGPLRNVTTVRVTDASILKAPMTLLNAAASVSGKVTGPDSAAAFVINHNSDNTLATLRFRLKDVPILVAEEPFGKFNAGSFLIKSAAGLRSRLERAVSDLGLTVAAVEQFPRVPAHALAAPRIALVHTWQSTQNEGWYRIAFDRLGIPYSYIDDHAIRDTPGLGAKYDVILLGPVPGTSQRIVNGIPMRGEPIPWKKSDIMPNIGTSPDQTDDTRGGMGLEGLLNLRKFVEQGGLFVTIAGNVSIPVDYGLIEGVSIVQTKELQARGSVLNARFADRRSPIAYGYAERLAIYFNQSPVLQVTSTAGLGMRGGEEPAQPGGRPTGRGSLTDPDIPQGRAWTPPPKRPELRPGEEPPIPDDVRDYYRNLLPPPEARPRIVLRFADEKELLVSGMLAGGRELANAPAVVDVPVGKGHIVLFANNPIWRQETQGSFFLLFNAMLNYDHLDAGRRQVQNRETRTEE